MKLRTLCAAEREALLELLDGWELPDGWRGREFFRRYVELDPAYRDENVWVAEDAGRLLSCLQIFPRRLRLRGAQVPLGGIGSVFTRPEARGAGVAGALLERALVAMRKRGFELSLLFAARLDWYARFGWVSWPGKRLLLRRDSAAPAPAAEAGLELALLDATREPGALRAIHEGYSGVRDGTLVRDTQEWLASLRLAGNPDEEVWLARRNGRAVAYLRAAVLYGFLVVLEVGREPDAAEELAQLLVALQTPRTPDRLAPQGRSSAELRGSAVLGEPRDPALCDALGRRGTRLTPVPDPSAMLQVLAPEALARRLGVPAPAGASHDWLRELVPPERFVYWSSDRF